MISGGLRAEVQFVDDELLKSIKSQLGIPTQLSSCHTATISQYFIEGHVPVNDIHRLLIERPQARGLTVPGMPIGSPGMEMGTTKEAFDTLLVFENGLAKNSATVLTYQYFENLWHREMQNSNSQAAADLLPGYGLYGVQGP